MSEQDSVGKGEEEEEGGVNVQEVLTILHCSAI